jgi:hypothetical protein
LYLTIDIKERPLLGRYLSDVSLKPIDRLTMMKQILRPCQIDTRGYRHTLYIVGKKGRKEFGLL